MPPVTAKIGVCFPKTFFASICVLCVIAFRRDIKSGKHTNRLDDIIAHSQEPLEAVMPN